MATGKICDIYGSAKDVKSYQVVVTDAAAVSASGPAVIHKTLDLCPRGLERLKAFISRGTSKPGIEADNAK